MQTIRQFLSASQGHLAKKIASASEGTLLAIFACLAFLVAFRVMHIQQGWVNVDSVLYFEAAKLFSIGEWKQGFALFGWPLYSMLIAALHCLTGLSFHASAQWLTAILFTITTVSFITLIRLAGGNRITIVCGALLLLSASYITGDILPMLLRDQGFWAFFLASLVFFIKFYREGRFQDALLWQLFSILAMLFRIEGITFLLFLPLVLFTDTSIAWKARLVRFAKAYTLNLLGAVILIVLFSAVPSLSAADFGRLQEIWDLSNQGIHNLAQQFTEKSTLMGNGVLGAYLDDYGSVGLASAFIGIVLMKILNTVGWVPMGLIVFGPKDKKFQIKPDVQRVFIFVSGLALLNIAMILLRSYVLSSRYIVALGFILLVVASFALAALINSSMANSARPNLAKSGSTESRPGKLKKWLLAIAIAILCLSLIKNLAPKRQGYAYEKEAVVWVKQNTPKGSSVFYVSPKARYYAGEPYVNRGYDYWEFTLKSIANGTIKNYDYLVINIDNRHPEREKQLTKTLVNYKLIKEFVGFKSRKKIMIFAKK